MKTVINNSEKNDDWMKSLPSYGVEKGMAKPNKPKKIVKLKQKQV